MNIAGILGGFPPRRENPNPIYKGLEAHMLGEGDCITMSRERHTGDRSWTDSIWEVMAVTPGHIMVKWSGVGPKPFHDEPKLIVVGEREFYDARPLVAALRAASGIEAASADETAEQSVAGSAEGESPAPKGDAQ